MRTEIELATLRARRDEFLDNLASSPTTPGSSLTYRVHVKSNDGQHVHSIRDKDEERERKEKGGRGERERERESSHLYSLFKFRSNIEIWIFLLGIL